MDKEVQEILSDPYNELSEDQARDIVKENRLAEERHYNSVDSRLERSETELRSLKNSQLSKDDNSIKVLTALISEIKNRQGLSSRNQTLSIKHHESKRKLEAIYSLLSAMEYEINRYNDEINNSRYGTIQYTKAMARRDVTNKWFRDIQDIL